MFYDPDAPKANNTGKKPEEKLEETLSPRAAAGRRNGKLAAGKKTPAGLAASARNATKHGYYSRTFTTLGTESEELYNELREGIRAEYAPATVTEHTLVEEIAQYRWLIQRTFNMENAHLNDCIATILQEDDARADAPDDDKVNVVAATLDGYQRAADKNTLITLLYRQRGQCQREVARATKDLEARIAARQKAAASADGPPAPARPIAPATDFFIPRSHFIQDIHRKLNIPERQPSKEISRNDDNGGDNRPTNPPPLTPPTEAKPTHE